MLEIFSNSMGVSFRKSLYTHILIASISKKVKGFSILGSSNYDKSKSIDWFLHDGNINLKWVKTIVKKQFKTENPEAVA